MGSPSRRADRCIDLEDDPRENGPSLGDERATLVEYLRCQRLTLEMKCSGLDSADLARRSVEPSTISLLGLVRHMAEVERGWFRRVLAGASSSSAVGSRFVALQGLEPWTSGSTVRAGFRRVQAGQAQPQPSGARADGELAGTIVSSLPPRSW